MWAYWNARTHTAVSDPSGPTEKGPWDADVFDDYVLANCADGRDAATMRLDLEWPLPGQPPRKRAPRRRAAPGEARPAALPALLLGDVGVGDEGAVVPRRYTG